MSENQSEGTTEHIRDRVCRLCLGENKKLAYIENLYFDEIHFVDILRDCFALEIDLEQHDLPLMICRKCVSMTINFQAFKNTIIENEVFLQCVNLDELDHRLRTNQNKTNFDLETLQTFKQTANLQENVETGEETTASNSCQATSRTERFEFSEFACAPDPKNSTNPNLISQAPRALKTPESNPILENEVLPRTISKCGVSSSTESGYACSICSSPIVDLSKKYSVVKQREKDYVCLTCGQRFKAPSEWKNHMISHYTAQKYHCLQCSESYNSKHELVVHSYTHLYKQSSKH